MNAITRPIETIVCDYIPDSVKTMYDLGVGSKEEWIHIPARYPGMKLYGCEPHIGQYSRLTEVFRGKLAPVAIAEKPGTAILYEGAEPMQSSLYPILQESARREVTVWTLDQFDEWAGYPSDILLWMDIEGSEVAALKGAHNLLASERVVAVNTEVREAPKIPGWASRDGVANLLSEYGFTSVKKYRKHETHYDELFVVSR